MALILWQQNKREEAAAEFKAALEARARQQDQRKVPEEFWRAVDRTLEELGQCKLLGRLRAEADRVLRTYVRRNGSYEVDLLLRAALRAAGDPAAGVAWIADLSKAAPERTQFLANIVRQSWIPEEQRPALYAALIQSTKEKLADTYGEARGGVETELRDRQVEGVAYLGDHKANPAAASALDGTPGGGA